jgi:UDP-glucuronate 4-epimerase
MTRVVVTGAAGFVGSHLVEALLHRGDEVVGIDNFDPFYDRATKERNLDGARGRPGFRFVEGDAGDPTVLGPALTPDSVVVHLAARPGVRPSLQDPRRCVEVNVGGTAAVAQAALAAGVRRVVFGSSSSVYGDDTPAPFREESPALLPRSPYAASKRAAELVLEALAASHDLRVLSLRYFTVYGPRQRPDLAIHAFARRMLQGEPIALFGPGDASRDYTYCSDIVAGTVAAIDRTADAPPGQEIVNLGGNRPVSLVEMVAALAAALRVDPIVRWGPPQAGDVRHTWADLGKAERLLGYRPAVGFVEGIARFAAWARERYA